MTPSENVLMLNLTTETLSFSPPLGSVPNRGLQAERHFSQRGVICANRQRRNQRRNRKGGRHTSSDPLRTRTLDAHPSKYF
jgi:hypothetical protein